MFTGYWRRQMRFSLKSESFLKVLFVVSIFISLPMISMPAQGQDGAKKEAVDAATHVGGKAGETATAIGAGEKADPFEESSIGGGSIFARAWQGGIVVFSVLLILVLASVLSWAIVIAKWMYLKRIAGSSESFTKSFWESRSLNELNGRLADHPYSPVKEVFRTGYAELVRGNQLKEQSSNLQMAISAAMENLGRALQKARRTERRQMEKYLPILAIIASVSPFIGLFGTVWGIMGSFEGIARMGSASLAAVAPGISEALIATAFGLAAAIPAVIGYNLANARIRNLLGTIDSFSSDFLNIVERYLVSDRAKKGTVDGEFSHRS